MILVFDIGNTNVVFGAMKDGEVLNQFRLQSDATRTTDEYGISILSLIHYNKIPMEDVHCVMISSVVPPLTFTFSRLVKKYFNRQPVIIDTNSDHGLDIRLDVPSSLGSDRLMTAVAAHNLYKSNCITVDYGTATTIEVLTEKGEFLGGTISPGVKMSAEALHSKTAQLPQVELARPERVIGQNTISSIQSGLFYGYVELVDGLIDRIKREAFGGKPVTMLATGGLGGGLSGASRHKMKYEPALILYGLYFMYLRLRDKL